MDARQKFAIGILALADHIPDRGYSWLADLNRAPSVQIALQLKLSDVGTTSAPWQSITPQALADHLNCHNLDLIVLLLGSCQPGALVPILDQSISTKDLILLPPPLPFPQETAQIFPQSGVAWAIAPALLQTVLQIWNAAGPLSCQSLSDRLKTPLPLADELEKMGIFLSWQISGGEPVTAQGIDLTMPSVLAVIPHWGCEPWLARSLASLVSQSRPPDQIVVVDDASKQPPIAVTTQFPQVTLVQADRHVGPYCLIQQVITTTQFDWYLFQDADDWSSADRLARLLHQALITQAELVGSQEMRVFDADPDLTPDLMPVLYPLDVNAALAEKPGHGLLHPTSLVARDLVIRLGGFATGWRFGADSEFLLRAVYAARVVNLPSYGYLRRKRPGSLTTNPETGLESPARQQRLHQIKGRAIANRTAQAAGQIPDLRPLSTASPVNLIHLGGPPLGNCETSDLIKQR